MISCSGSWAELCACCDQACLTIRRWPHHRVMRGARTIEGHRDAGDDDADGRGTEDHEVLRRGGRSATYERELQRARDIAIEEMQEKAAALGGNAVVGVDLDYEVLGQGNGMLMVSASGTAVVVE